MTSRVLVIVGLCLLFSAAAAAQSLDCMAAFDTMTRVKEQILDPDADLDELHHIISARTNDCEDLAALWLLRAQLANYRGDARDEKLSLIRSGVKNALDGKVIRAAMNRNEGFDPSTPIRNRVALVAGTSIFSEKLAKKLPPLEHADDDLTKMDSLLRDTLAFNSVRSLTQEEFTLANFRAEIARLVDETNEDDLVVIYLVSHGLPTAEAKNNVSYVVAYDSNIDNARQRYLTTIEIVDLVQEVYREIPAKRILLLLDTCYSGDAITGQKSYAGHPAPHLLDQLTRGSGRAVIAAAGADQRSYELAEQQQGAFVYCLNEALTRAPNLRLGELFVKVRSCVTTSVHSEHGAGLTQQPVMFAAEGARDIVLARHN